jgi:modulator of FtsH protease HflK
LLRYPITLATKPAKWGAMPVILPGGEDQHMPWNNQSGGPWGSGSKPPDLEQFLRRSQDRLRGLTPGNLGGRGFALIAVAAVALWGFSGFFRVEPDELGVVLRFGQFVREVPPGLNYHLPYPIETALTPHALRVNKIDIGFDLRRGSTMRDVPEESLMLTGDENIVDVNFSVFWKVKPDHVGDYLFNVESPESTVKAVGESVMRAVIGHSNIQGILTGDRQSIETVVQKQMQKTLDDYGAGVVVQQVQLQRVDPPTQVIEAFRDVQRASSDLERAQNEAQTKPTGWCRKRAAGPPRSSRTPKPIANRPSLKRRARPHVSRKFMSNTKRRPT